MRLHILRLGIATMLALGALGLLALAVLGASSVSTAPLSPAEAGGAQQNVDLQQIWRAPAENGEPQMVSDRLVSISARRMISDPGLNTPLVLSENGRKIAVTGHLNCIKGDDYEIQTAVTQSSTGALARGKTQGQCAGKAGQFSAATWAYDEALFKPGPAQACAVLIIRTAAKISDVFQWCRKEDVNLTAERASY
jgi:hypothetical protein